MDRREEKAKTPCRKTAQPFRSASDKRGKGGDVVSLKEIGLSESIRLAQSSGDAEYPDVFDGTSDITAEELHFIVAQYNRIADPQARIGGFFEIAAALSDRGHLREDLDVIAGDEFGGRRVGTSGNERTIEYLKKEVDAAGLETAVIDTGILGYVAHPTKYKIEINSGGDVSVFDLRDVRPADVSMSSVKKLEDREYPVVFAYYGIDPKGETHLPEYSDYRGIDAKPVDVSGKIVMLLDGFPCSSSDRCGVTASDVFGNDLGSASDIRSKAKDAMGRGAAGVLVVKDVDETGEVSVATTMSPLISRGSDVEQIPVATISEEAADEILKGTGISIKDAIAQTGRADYSGGMARELEGIKIRWSNEFVPDWSGPANNLEATLGGSSVGDRYVVVSAHIDGVGPFIQVTDYDFNRQIPGFEDWLKNRRLIDESSVIDHEKKKLLTAKEAGLGRNSYGAECARLKKMGLVDNDGKVVSSEADYFRLRFPKEFPSLENDPSLWDRSNGLLLAAPRDKGLLEIYSERIKPFIECGLLSRRQPSKGMRIKGFREFFPSYEAFSSMKQNLPMIVREFDEKIGSPFKDCYDKDSRILSLPSDKNVAARLQTAIANFQNLYPNSLFEMGDVSWRLILGKNDYGDYASRLEMRYKKEICSNPLIWSQGTVASPPQDPELRKKYDGLIESYLKNGVMTEDTVFNGAEDDGTGTVALLELARNFRRLKDAGLDLPFNIKFLFANGEEEGLLGSAFAGRNSSDMPYVIGQVNLDMVASDVSAPIAVGYLNQASAMGYVAAAPWMQPVIGEIGEMSGRKLDVGADRNYDLSTSMFEYSDNAGFTRGRFDLIRGGRVPPQTPVSLSLTTYDLDMGHVIHGVYDDVEHINFDTFEVSVDQAASLIYFLGLSNE